MPCNTPVGKPLGRGRERSSSRTLGESAAGDFESIRRRSAVVTLSDASQAIRVFRNRRFETAASVFGRPGAEDDWRRNVGLSVRRCDWLAPRLEVFDP